MTLTNKFSILDNNSINSINGGYNVEYELNGDIGIATGIGALGATALTAAFTN